MILKATFIELPVFNRYRENYLSDEEFGLFQRHLMGNPYSGDVIKGTGGLRKIRWKAMYRGKGKRGGTRIIYYWFSEGGQFWLFTVYGKDEMPDISTSEKKELNKMLTKEKSARLDR